MTGNNPAGKAAAEQRNECIVQRIHQKKTFGFELKRSSGFTAGASAAPSAKNYIQAPRVCGLNSRERLARHVEPEGGFNQGAGDALSGGGGCGYTQIRMSASRPDLSCEAMHRSAECQTPFPRRFQSKKHRRRGERKPAAANRRRKHAKKNSTSL